VKGALELAKGNGFRPWAIVDIGAYVGNGSRMAAKYSLGLLGPEERQEVTIFQNGTGTSVLRQLTSFSTRRVQVAMRMLDSLLGPEHLRGPLLLKLDVQGFELEVLCGGMDTIG
jgi:hypothetical protein